MRVREAPGRVIVAGVGGIMGGGAGITGIVDAGFAGGHGVFGGCLDIGQRDLSWIAFADCRRAKNVVTPLTSGPTAATKNAWHSPDDSGECHAIFKTIRYRNTIRDSS
ncbi:hypothetical protein BBSC_2072 [Bifidobacterium scardovii JCM 12489 = DSM 13734]|nr:hypothetical protein BBSC_2072 [Bifidobacterium scardovii JCM 12489 = DSM 13734]